MLTLEDASAVNGENTETISQRILSGELHTVKIENGQTLICFDSMIQDKTKLLNKEQNNENE